MATFHNILDRSRAVRHHADMGVQRRYPRVPYEQPGEMEIRVRVRAGVAARAVRVPVTIRTVSCEGMGLALRSRDLPRVGVGESVTMRLDLGTTRLEIPGRIAWFDPRHPETRYDLGVHLRLELARAVMRQQWAEWVVGLIRSRAHSTS